MSGIYTTLMTAVEIYLTDLARVLASGSATGTRSGPHRLVGAVFPLPPFRCVRATPLMTLLCRDLVE